MSGMKRCAECGLRTDAPTFDVSTDDGQTAVITHYLEEHPESSAFADVVDGSFVRRECNDCGRPFWAVAGVGHDGDGRAEIVADAYCPDCETNAPIRQLIVETVPPSEFVADEGKPFEDALGDREVRAETERSGGRDE